MPEYPKLPDYALVGFTLTREHSLNPVCYLYYLSDLLIYVGYSKHGLKRVFSTQKESEPDRTEALSVCTSFRVEVFEPRLDGLADDAYEREEKLIHEHHPLFNRACRACNTSSHPKALRAYVWGRSEQECKDLHEREHVRNGNEIGRAYCRYCV